MLELDHIVFAGKDVATVSAAYGDKFKVKAIKGGDHEAWGTYNYLAYFSNNSYVEWLGINDYEKAGNSNNPLIQHLVYLLNQDVQGPFQFALNTNHLDQYVEHFKKNDIPFTGPYQGIREKPDGTKLTWRMLFPSYDFKKETLPFLIEWDQPSHVRINPSLINAKAITRVDFGGTTLKRFVDIYQLPHKKRLKNKVFLRNTKLYFTESGILTFNLV